MQKHLNANHVQMQDNLRPDLAVYMELGNEAWHTGFFGGNQQTSQDIDIVKKFFKIPRPSNSIWKSWNHLII